ncbi:MAG: beta-ketoacyl-ACP synthase II [Planctomycetes bacterium]|jgi:3-oxoacyl-[acyl-carrier-protein] synthase II|nr:beta-ketoacyl-ACP synthase II [Planctomycetota bacterium]
MRRVVITGLGAVTACGLNVRDTWASLKAGRSGVARLSAFDPSELPSQVAAELKGFDPTVAVEAHEVKRFDRFILYALVAAKEAIGDSGLEIEKSDPERGGVIIGSGIGGLQTIEEQHLVLQEKGPRRVSPYFVPKIMMNAASGQVSILHGLKGANFATASACASSAHALGMTFRLIRAGELDFALTGGSEAVITKLCVAGFCSLKALSTSFNSEPERASRPFDAKRDGFVLGEGGGILMFEELEHAKRRGARIYAEVKGFGQTADAFNIVQPAPEGEGAARAMNLALADARLAPESIQYINAHGTSTPFNDKLETQAIHRIFGAHARRLMVSSSKSMVGHLLGGAGAVEMIFTALSIHEGVIHPTINYEFPDPECDLDFVPNVAREVQVENALSNSLGFGGHNASLVVGRLTA